MLGGPVGAGQLARELRALLESARLRARSLGRPVAAAHTRIEAAAADPLALLAAAEQTGERRFYAARPAQEFALAAIGAARAETFHGSYAVARARARWDQLLREAVVDAPDGLAQAAGPLAVGGIAFEPRPELARAPEWSAFGSASFALPELAVVRRAGASFVTRAAMVAPDADVERLLERWRILCSQTGRRAQPLAARTAEPVPSLAYRDAVSEVVAAIGRGEAQKVVLATAESHERAGFQPVASSLALLLETHPGCFTFAQGLGNATFLGSSPERLVRSSGRRVESWAVAGTAPRGATEPETEALARALAGSSKEQSEHAFVVREITHALDEMCDELEAAPAPEPLYTGTLQHLYTRIAGRLREPMHALDLVAALHPTPALCGAPRARALELIRKHEPFDRGWYGGPIGWFDAAGSGDFFVALRCALLAGDRATLYAGSGLVSASQPDREAAETALKLRAMREALALP
jgi:isochorismate synthase